jgi:hypothetical protein
LYNEWTSWEVVIIFSWWFIIHIMVIKIVIKSNFIQC